MDGCLTGGGGYVSQGQDLEKVKVIAFWSGKWNSAQQNYLVHKLELLALIKMLKQFQGILHGTQFTVRTDHHSLEHLMKQRNLSAHQHQWLDVLNEFDFTIRYIPGVMHSSGRLRCKSEIWNVLGFCLYPIDPGRFSNQHRTSADRCTPTLPR